MVSSYLSLGTRTIAAAAAAAAAAPAAGVGRRAAVRQVRCMSSVIHLSDNLDAVDKFTQLNAKCCIYYTASWCGPCRQVKPVYEQLAAEYKGRIALGTVDVDANTDAAAAAQITAVPTFTFHHNNSAIKQFSGADQQQLHSVLAELASKE